jgi:hypothetical protein
MAAKLEKTKTRGVFKRGLRYVVVDYAAGKQRKESAPAPERRPVGVSLLADQDACICMRLLHKQ